MNLENLPVIDIDEVWDEELPVVPCTSHIPLDPVTGEPLPQPRWSGSAFDVPEPPRDDETLEAYGTPWAELYMGSGRRTGYLAAEPVRCADGSAAPNWEWVGDETIARHWNAVLIGEHCDVGHREPVPGCPRCERDQRQGFLTAKQVAEMRGITPRRVRAIARRRGLGWQVPGTRQWLFTPEEAELLRGGPPGRPAK